MDKTSTEYCSKCKYVSNDRSCNYLLVTRESRGCKVGECDKREIVSRKEKIEVYRKLSNFNIPKN